MQLHDDFDSAALRQAMGSFATGVAIATCHAEGRPYGITVNSLTSVSLDPPLMLFCLSNRTRVYPDFMAAGHFALNILAVGQEHLSRHFAGAQSEDWTAISTQSLAMAPPLLTGCMAWLVCRTQAVHPGGDHAIIIGEITQLGCVPTAQPLLYFRKHYRHLTTSGHEG